MVVAATLSSNLFFWWLAQIIAVAILVILFLRWRPGFLGGRTIKDSMNGALDARSDAIREQLEAAQRSREEAARLHAEAQRDVENARTEAAEIVERASHTSAAIGADLERRAREEYDRVVGQARSQIEFERERALSALRRRAADIVIDSAREVVERTMEPRSDRRVIQDSLSNLKDIS
jgi:F-type H+-transporting ATPase subunit b